MSKGKAWLLVFLGWTAFVLWTHPQTRLFFECLFQAPELFQRIAPAPFPLTTEALFRHLLRLARLALLLASAWGCGRAALRPLGLEWDNRREEGAFVLGAGLGLQSLVVLGLGLLGLLYPSVLLVFIITTAAAGARELLAAGRKALGERRKPRSPDSDSLPAPLKIAFAGIAAGALLIQLPHLLAPETFYDALLYHLNLPKLYLLNHAIFPVPSILYSGNPFVSQMLFTLALALDGPVLARFLHFSTGVIAVLSLCGLAQRWRQPQAGWLSAVYFLTIPVVLYESYNTSTALEWTLFQTLAFHSLVIALDEPRESPRRGRLTVLCGLFAGLAMGTKYPAWMLPIPLCAAFLCAQAWRPLPLCARARESALVLGLAFLMLSPWLAKNVAHYKNPVFPYLEETFDREEARHIDTDALNRDAGRRDLRRTFGSWQGFKEYALHPWTYSTRVASCESDYLGPLFLTLLPLVVLYRRRHFPSALWSVLCLAAWIPLSLMTVNLRFLIPVLAPLSFLLAYGLLRLPWAGLRLCAISVSAFIVCVHAALAGVMVPGSHKWDVVSGRQSEEDYLSRTHANYPAPPHAAIRYLNANAPKEAKVLMVGDPRGLYLERDHLSSSIFNTEIYFRMLEESRDAQDLKERLDRMGVTHFLVNARYLFARAEGAARLTQKAARSHAAYWGKYILKAHESFDKDDHWVIVYRILSEEEALQAHPRSDFLSADFNRAAP